MAVARDPLPPALLTGAHPAATLLRNGVSRRELRARVLWRPGEYGLWSWAAHDPAAVDERIRRAAALVRDGGAMGGWAAAWIHGARDVDGESASGQQQPVLVCLPASARCRRGPGVTVFRSRLEPDEVVDVDGVLVTSPVRTAIDLARLTTPWREAVVGVDALRAASRLDVEHVAGWLTTHRRWRGVPQARRVLAESRDGVRSPQESRLRLLWTHDAGLADPCVNATVLCGDGVFLCEPDLVDPTSGLVAEFDGAHHAAADRRGADKARLARMRRAGLTVVVVTGPGLTRQRAATVVVPNS